jgi:hypothetical protein
MRIVNKYKSTNSITNNKNKQIPSSSISYNISLKDKKLQKFLTERKNSNENKSKRNKIKIKIKNRLI